MIVIKKPFKDCIKSCALFWIAAEIKDKMIA